MSALPLARYSVDEYLALDRAAELKSEYHDGELFPLVAVSLAHGRIVLAAGSAILQKLPPTGCQVAASIRVQVSSRKFVYPDLAIVCGKPQLTDEHQDTLTNPKVIIEVLSPSTADYDYGGKFALYRALPSFAEYVLISQEQPRVEVFTKQPNGDWLLRTIDGLDARVELQSLSFAIPMAEIYRGTEFPPPVED